jgi:hypothetical protein
MAKGRTRKTLGVEEKTLKALHALFILQAAQLQIGNREIRKVLGVGMNEITAATKEIKKAMKSLRKKQ